VKTRIASSLLVLVALPACRGAASHDASAPVATSASVTVASDPSPEDTVGPHREELRLASAGRLAMLRLAGATLLLETANADVIDRARTFIAVNVESDQVRIGGKRARTPDDVARAVHLIQERMFGPVVFLVRADDNAAIGRLRETIEALQRAGALHVVFGWTSPAEVLASWDACPFPAKADAAAVDAARIMVQAQVDDREHAGLVQVLTYDENGFGGAAALCVMRQRLTGGLASGKPFRVRFERPTP